MANLARVIGYFFDRVLELFAAIAAAIVFAIAISVSIDVVSRYYFRNPLGWPIEFSEYGLVAMTFLSMAWLVRKNGHVRIDLFVERFDPVTQSRLNAATNFVSGLICSACAYFAALTALSQFRRGVMTTAIYAIPRYTITIIIAIGLALTAIEFLRAAIVRQRSVN